MSALLSPKFDLLTHQHLLLTFSQHLKKVFSNCLYIPLRPTFAVPIITNLTDFLLASGSLNAHSFRNLTSITLLLLFISENCLQKEYYCYSKYLLLSVQVAGGRVETSAFAHHHGPKTNADVSSVMYSAVQ